MQELIDRAQVKSMKKIVDIRPGYTVRVHQKIREGDKERVQIFEGVVIKINSGRGVDKTFTARKVVQGIGVEKIFPLHSSNIVQIEIKKQSKVRRAKLYYTRERFGKKARMKGDFVDIKAIEEAPAAAVASEEAAENAEEEAAKTEEVPQADAEVVEEPKTEVKAEAVEEPKTEVKASDAAK